MNAIEDSYPLSPMQQGMLFHSLYEQQSGVYSEQIICNLHENLNVSAFMQSWQRVIERHSVLRTSFFWEGSNQPVQSVYRQVKLPLKQQDWRGLSESEQENQLQAYLQNDRQRDFDLKVAPLMRLALFQLAEADYKLVWTFHHALLDGRSFVIVLKEIFAYYEAFCQNQNCQLEKPRPYRDYIDWRQQQSASKAEEFWRRLLQGFTAPTQVLSVATDMERRIRSYGVQAIRLSGTNTSALQSLAQEHQLTLNTIVQGAWALLLGRYSGEDDVVFGATRACRYSAIEGMESMVGLFINTLPMRVQVAPDLLLLPWLKELRSQWISLRDHEHTSLLKLQEWSEVPRGMPLFESIVMFENYEMNAVLREAGGNWKHREFQLLEQINYPLVLTAYAGSELLLKINYDCCKFDRSAIARMLGHLETLLTGIATNSQQRLCELPLLTAAEQHQLLMEWNQRQTEYPQDKCIHQLFEGQVERTPEAVAVVFEQQQLTYAELNARANMLANYLRSLGVGPEVLVGICLERCLEMVVGLLGILKAGGAYVPLDPAYPAERLAFMLSDSQVKLVLTQAQLVETLPAHQARVICLDADWEAVAQHSPQNPVKHMSVDNLAYVIYTSGSTGKPKGVLVNHQNLVRLFAATEGWFQFAERDVWTLFHSYAFDFSVWEIWGALLYGGRLIVVPYWVSRSPAAFYELLAKQQVTVLNQTPSAFRQLIQAEASLGTAQPDLALRLVIFGGEALELQSLKPWFERHGDQFPQLVNMYGITETTVHVTYRPLLATDLSTNAKSAIGVAIPDLAVYILDQHLQPVPVGIPGEMYIGGAGVARGYLNRPELTQERFIPHPFCDQPGARLYKSGDLARYLPNRDIEYLGRIDQQVKIRGFRIELGEIEATLGSYPGVRAAIVLVRSDSPGEKRLVAYLVPGDGVKLSVMELRQFLKHRLPEYMLPSALVMLEALPLTANGKLDCLALPSPGQSWLDLDRRYVAPRTSIEAILAKIWTDVLRLKQVGICDNFFELGGDSILSIQIIAKAKREGIQLSPNQLFLHPTISELTEAACVAPTLHSKQDLVQGWAPLTPIQHWFFEQDFPTYDHWNQAFLFEVKQVLDMPLLESAVQHLIQHHDALRLRFNSTNTGYQQSFADSEQAALVTQVDLTNHPLSDQVIAIAATANEVQASLNLSKGPLLKIVYFNLGYDQPGRLLIVIHHLIIDGISWRILREDLELIYHSLQTNTVLQLPSKTTSYQQWAISLMEYAQSSHLMGELDYWIKTSEAGVVPIPVDFNPFGDNSEASVRSISVSLDRDATQALLKQVPSAYNTQINDVLLTALAQTLATWAGHNSILIDLEGHGREEVIKGLDLSRTVGWFTTIFPVCLDINGHTSPGSVLKSVKEQLRRIPNRGIGYGILRYLTGNPTVIQQLQAAPKPQVVFNYLGQVEQVVADSSLFAFARESAGQIHSPVVNRRHLLEILGQVLDGQLTMTWLYSENIHRVETIEQLAKDFINTLGALITHCQSVDAPCYTPSDFPLAKLDLASLDQLLSENRNIEDIYPLSPTQQLFYSIDTINPAVGFEQWHFMLHGNLNTAAFRQAWEQVVNQHSILRSAFKSEGFSEPHQVVYKHVNLPWTEHDWRGLFETKQQFQLASFLQADRERSFDISQAPLTRIALIQVADAAYHLIWSTHHLEIDGWSWPLVFKDLSHLFEAFQLDQTVDIKKSPPYRNYVTWLQQQDFGKAEAFWRQTLKGFTVPTPLTGSKRLTRSPNRDIHFGEIDVCLSSEVLAALQSLARQNQVTLNTLFQGAWALLLSAANGLEEVVFGATFSGRPAELDGVESMVGPFVNNLPVRVQVSPGTSLFSWLQQLQAQQMELSCYQHTPLTKIQAWSDVPLRDRLFDSLIVFQNYVVDESALRLGEYVTIRSIASPQATNYPLTIVAVPGQDLPIKIIYHGDRFDESTVTAILQDFQQVLEGMATGRPSQLSDLLAAKMAWKEIERDKQALAKLAGQHSEVKPTYMPPDTEMEQTIAKVWQKAFGVDAISIYDNFFDLGGYSIMLIAVHEELQSILDTKFPIAKMFQHSTVSSLAYYLSQGQGDKPAYEKVQNRAQRQREALMRMKQLKRG